MCLGTGDYFSEWDSVVKCIVFAVVVAVVVSCVHFKKCGRSVQSGKWQHIATNLWLTFV